MVIVKNAWELLDHETLKSGVFSKRFDESSRLIQWYLDVNSDGIIFGLVVNIICIFVI